MVVQIVTVVLAFLGTLIGSVAGILTANKLTNYRIEQLEKKVSVHNQLIDRMYEVEKREEIIEEKINLAHHKIDDMQMKMEK